MRKAVVIGAGPAGLTAAYELVDKAEDIEVIVLEESEHMGGISKTVNYKGNRMDMGGHRFFSKVDEVNEWWDMMLPMQGSPASDYKTLGITVPLKENGPDPEKVDETMLMRQRVSRIFYNKKFFDYPISLKPETFTNMGLLTTIQVGFSYLASVFHKREEKSLEDFYINRFGKKLYSMFFERYTENLWGRHPSVIAPDWGSQRVKGLSIAAILKDILRICGADIQALLLLTGAVRELRVCPLPQFLRICFLSFCRVRRTARLKPRLLRNSNTQSLVRENCGTLRRLRLSQRAARY